MRRRWWLLLLLVPVVLIIWVGFAIFGPDWWVYQGQFHQGNKAVGKIEAFHKRYGRLPNSFKEAGADDDEEQLRYELCGEGRYNVWFPTEQDWMLYDSQTGTWAFANSGCLWRAK